MADQLDNRPVFTIVMGCNGAGKSAWMRANRDRLPERHYDKDSIADGVGGWDTTSARERTDTIVNEAVDEAMAGRHSFGIESTYSGQPGRAMVEPAPVVVVPDRTRSWRALPPRSVPAGQMPQTTIRRPSRAASRRYSFSSQDLSRLGSKTIRWPAGDPQRSM